MDGVNFTGLAPNFAEIVVSKTTLNIYSAEFAQRFWDECRQEKGDTFYYRRGNLIYAWSRSGVQDAQPIGFTPTTVTLEHDPDVFAKVIQQSIVSYFKNIPRDTFKERHSSNYFFRIDGDSEVYKISNLSFVPHFYFSVGYLKRNNRTIIYLSCWKEFKRRFEVPESTIQSEGIDTRNWDRRNDRIVGSPKNIKKYISAVRGERQLKQIQLDIHNRISEFAYIKKSLRYLNKQCPNIKVIDGLTINGLSHLGIPNDDLKEFSISRPSTYFYNNATSNGRLDQLVSNLKPYTYEQMSAGTFNIVAFIPKPHSGTCDDFLGKLKLKVAQIFHLKNIDITAIPVGTDRNEHIQEISKFNHNQYDLAFTFLNLADKSQSLLQSDYNKIKAKLLGKGIPSQNFLMETVRSANNYTLNNAALNVYSKLGGTPWIIDRDNKSTLELIVGIGSSLDQDNNRTIGFASVFDHHGAYVLGGCSPLSNMENYAEKLREHIKGIVAEAIQVQGVEPNSTIRLIFHLFKDASRYYEIKAILETIECFADYKIEYALVHISYHHPYRLYQEEGKNIVTRGVFIEISDNWALLNMGVQRSTPLLIKVDPRSTYTDLYDLSKQILHFSHLSHKSFMPSNEPVTTKYSSELARRTNDLLTVPHWDIDMLQQLKEKVWFI
ncbi:Piwi domain-containing protein [Saccharophagus degradans]|uniref:Piwi domain-containing protein n=1 Tax=Saccharophagus degradans TaxID=86304 RepID=UPI003A81100E